MIGLGQTRDGPDLGAVGENQRIEHAAIYAHVISQQPLRQRT